MDQLPQIVFRFREDANSFLSRYEPIALVTVPLIILILARATESFISAVQEKGLVRAVLAFAMVSVRYKQNKNQNKTVWFDRVSVKMKGFE